LIACGDALTGYKRLAVFDRYGIVDNA